MTGPGKVGETEMRNRIYAAPLVTLHGDEDENVPRLYEIDEEFKSGNIMSAAHPAATVTRKT